MVLSTPALEQVTIEWPQQPALYPKGYWEICPLRKILGCSRDWGITQGQVLVLGEKRLQDCDVLSYLRIRTLVWTLQLSICLWWQWQPHTGNRFVYLLPRHTALRLYVTICDHFFPSRLLSVFVHHVISPISTHGARRGWEKLDAIIHLHLACTRNRFPHTQLPRMAWVEAKQDNITLWPSIIGTVYFLATFSLSFFLPFLYLSCYFHPDCLLLLWSSSLRLPANTSNIVLFKPIQTQMS